MSRAACISRSIRHQLCTLGSEREGRLGRGRGSQGWKQKGATTRSERLRLRVPKGGPASSQPLKTLVVQAGSCHWNIGLAQHLMDALALCSVLETDVVGETRKSKRVQIHDCKERASTASCDMERTG